MSTESCPFETPDCKYFNGPLGCHQSTHHELYPKKDYQSPIEKRYRELPENKFEICRAMHDEIHAFDELPVKPSIEVMRHAVNESRINRLVSQGGAS